MEYKKLNSTVRVVQGKGYARRMRIAGNVPAVVYGKSIDSIKLSILPREIKEALSGPLRINTPLNLVINGGDKKTPKEVLVMVSDHQYEPVSRNLLHVDFCAIAEDKPIRCKVPFLTTGLSEGVKLGGILSLVFREIPVICLPSAIPESIEVDVSNLKLHESISVKKLPTFEGVEIDLPLNVSVVSIVASRLAEEEETTTADGDETTDAAEGADNKNEAKDTSAKKE